MKTTYRTGDSLIRDCPFFKNAMQQMLDASDNTPFAYLVWYVALWKSNEHMS